MKKNLKRILATIMMVLIVLTSAPLQGFVGMDWKAFAATDLNKYELTDNMWYNSIQTNNQYEFLENGTVIENPGNNQRVLSYIVNKGILILTWPNGTKTTLKYVSKNDDYDWEEDLYFYNKIYPTIGESEKFFYETDWVYSEAPSDNIMWLRIVDNKKHKVGDIIEFGSYPQTKVKDKTLIVELNKLAPDWSKWRSYGYYSGTGEIGTMVKGDWMRYTDVNYKGSVYRGVKFTQCRADCTYQTAQYANAYSYQDDNGYDTNISYWFKFDPIEWRILDPNTGFVMCESIIDSQPYSNTIYQYGTGSYSYFYDFLHTRYASNYEVSSIRKWLNDDFYNTAFTEQEKDYIKTTALNNDSYYTCKGITGYESLDSKETNDKIFLLSYDDMKNNSYGFSSDSYNLVRRAKGSDYAKCQGLYVSDGVYASYFLRTAGYLSTSCCFVEDNGYLGAYLCYVANNYYGVRPAMMLNFENDYVEPNIKIVETSHPIINDILITNINDETFQVAVGLWDQNQQLVKDPDLKVSIKDKSVQYVSEKHFPEGYTVYTFKILNMESNELIFESSKYSAKYTLPVWVQKHLNIYNCEHIERERKDWDCKASSDQLYMTDFKCTHSNGVSDVTFNMYNTSESYGTVDVIGKGGELKHSYKVDPFKMGSGFELIVNGFKYSYIDLTSKDPFYRKESNAEKTSVSIKGLCEGDRIIITQNPNYSKMVKLYNGLDILISCTMMAVSLDLDADTTKKAIDDLIEDMLDNLSETAITSLAKEIGEAMINGSTKEVVENVVQVFGATFEEINYNYGEVITNILKNLGYEVANTAMKFYVPGWAVADTILQVTEIAYLITDYTLFDHIESVTIYSYEHTNITKPEKTKNLKSLSQELNSVKLTWDKVTGADGYRIYKYDPVTGKYPSVGYVARETSFTVSNLSLGSHKFKVRAYLNTDNGPVWGEYSDVLTVSTKPGKTTNLKASSQTTDSVTLSWSAVKGADGYRIYKYDPSTGKYPTVGYIPGKTSFKVTGLSTGTKYKFKVRAYINTDNGPVWGEYTNVLTASTKTVAPSKITSAQNTTKIKLSWNACPGATGYRIFYKSGNTWKTCLNATTATSHTFTGLKAGSKFTFAVRPYIVTDSGVVWSDYTTYTASTLPAIPKTAVTSPSSGKITVKWNAVSGAEAYQLYYKTGNGAYKLYKNYFSAQTVSFSGLKSGTKYTFAVRAAKNTSGGWVFGSFTPVSVTVK